MIIIIIITCSVSLCIFVIKCQFPLNLVQFDLCIYLLSRFYLGLYRNAVFTANYHHLLFRFSRNYEEKKISPRD